MRYAVCNEFFGEMEFARAAELTAARGFRGIELAPYTLFGDFSPAAVAAGIRTARRGLADSGLAFAGMHWLFVKPPGLRVTSPDSGIRKQSWDHLTMLLDAAGELGGGNLIFGSPKQRFAGDVPRSEALAHFRDGLAGAGRRAASRASKILLEALPSATTDILNTMAETDALLADLNCPGLSGMFDFHNTTDETEPWERLIERHWNNIAHVHLNTPDGGWPKSESSGFDASFSLLSRKGFDGWVSLEIFSVPGEPEKVLDETMAFLRHQEKICKSP